MVPAGFPPGFRRESAGSPPGVRRESAGCQKGVEKGVEHHRGGWKTGWKIRGRVGVHRGGGGTSTWLTKPC